MIRKINVLMMPDYRIGNPFQYLLEQSLSKQDIEVSFVSGYKRMLPIYREMKKHRGIDLLHLHWITPYLKGNNVIVVSLYAIKTICDIALTRLSGTPIVWTIHNQVSHDAKFPKVEIFTYRMISKLVNAAILHGYSLRDAIIKDYRISTQKLSIINLGNYKDVYSPLIDQSDARKKLLVPLDVKKIFLHQGMLKPYKGIEDLILVWNQHSDELKDSLLIIAGKTQDVDYENSLKSKVVNNKSIRLISRYVTDEEITTLYSACDVVVLPFRKIMASSSVMVAISFGKPVIAPKLGASEELLGEASDLLYDSENDGLISAIHKSLPMDLSELSKRTAARAELYNWNDIGKKTASLYRKTILSEAKS